MVAPLHYFAAANAFSRASSRTRLAIASLDCRNNFISDTVNVRSVEQVQMALDSFPVRLLASVPLALEYEAKCLDPRHCSEAGLSKEDAHIFVDGVIALMDPVHMDFLW